MKSSTIGDYLKDTEGVNAIIPQYELIITSPY